MSVALITAGSGSSIRDNGSSIRDNGPIPGPPVANPNYFPSNPVQELSKISWWKASIAALVSTLVPPIGAIIGAGLIGYWSKNGVPSNVTAEEDSQIQTWFNSVFMPFIGTITRDTASVLLNGVTPANITVLNRTLNYLCILKTHYATNDGTTFLSDAALDYRYEILAEACEALEKEIAAKISAAGLSYSLQSVTAQAANFTLTPLITVATAPTFQCLNYLPGRVATTDGSIKTLTPAVQTVPTATTTIATTTTTDDNDKKHPLIYIGGTILTLWGIKELFFSKSKPKSN